MNAQLQAFHFLRPWCLLALPLLLGLVLWLARRHTRDQDCSSWIDPDLLAALRLDGNAGGPSRSALPWPWLALAWALAVLALAGPSWQQEAGAAYRAPAAWVLVLDLSPSMSAADLAPTRATRARYALDDILGAAHDARVGMVAFTDEPYTVAPLTQDVATVRALLPPLAPDMMPSPGDHLAPALEQAGRLLSTSGASDKRIVLLSDGFDDPAAANAAASALRKQGVFLSVVGVGTSAGAPLRQADGRLAQDEHGQLQLARLDTEPLRQLAASGNGRYLDLAKLPELISQLQSSPLRASDAIAVAGAQVGHWRDEGAYLLPVLLLLAALLTRRRWL